jgi:hypothetical protein
MLGKKIAATKESVNPPKVALRRASTRLEFPELSAFQSGNAILG